MPVTLLIRHTSPRTLTHPVLGGESAFDLEISLPLERTTLRAVVEEHARAGLRRGRDLASPPSAAEESAAVAHALEAFALSRFIVLVGDRQIADLDAALELRADTAVRFLPLVPLTGGTPPRCRFCGGVLCGRRG